MAVDVLEGHVPRVAHAAAGLHRAVCRFAGEAVGAVVGHRHQVRDLHVVPAVECRCRAAHEAAHQLAVRPQLSQRELDALVLPQGLAPHLALARPLDGLIDAEGGRAEARGGLADAVLVHEALR